MQEICERLVRDGHETTVYTTDAYDLEYFWSPRSRRVEARTDCVNGVRIVRFPIQHLPWPRASFGGLRYGLALLSRAGFVPSGALRFLSGFAPFIPTLNRELSTTSDRFDVIHGMNICFESLLWPAFRYARRTGAGFVVTPLSHLGEPGSSRVRQYYTMRHQIDLESRADAILAQTTIEADYLAGRGVPRDILHRVGVGVDPSELAGGVAERFRSKYGIDRPFVFYVGASAFDKGTEHLVRAMMRLWAEGEEADLVLAGTSLSSFDQFLRSLDSRARLRCHSLGFIPEEDKKDLLAAGSILAMPSRTDSFGIAYLESWLYGKPVIGARAGGVPEVISDRQDGLLVEFGDVEGLVGRISELLSDPVLSKRLGEAGRRKVHDRYTWDALYPLVREQLERAAAEPRARQLRRAR